MLTLIRGLPGSGKSTLAKYLSTIGPANHFEADMYHMIDGVYRFDPTKIKDAHKWCQDATRAVLEADLHVVVSNTFTQLWEMEPYLSMAKSLNVPVRVIKCIGKWGNIHGVPPEVLKSMTSRWEDFEGEEKWCN